MDSQLRDDMNDEAGDVDDDADDDVCVLIAFGKFSIEKCSLLDMLRGFFSFVIESNKLK